MSIFDGTPKRWSTSTYVLHQKLIKTSINQYYHFFLPSVNQLFTELFIYLSIFDAMYNAVINFDSTRVLHSTADLHLFKHQTS